MDLHYISDDTGRQTAVIIPIEERKNLSKKYANLRELEEPHTPTTKMKPSDYVGCISKELGDEMQDYVTKSRNEWERDF